MSTHFEHLPALYAFLQNENETFSPEPWLLRALVAFRTRQWPALADLLGHVTPTSNTYHAMSCVTHYHLGNFEAAAATQNNKTEFDVTKRYRARAMCMQGRFVEAAAVLGCLKGIAWERAWQKARAGQISSAVSLLPAVLDNSQPKNAPIDFDDTIHEICTLIY